MLNLTVFLALSIQGATAESDLDSLVKQLDADRFAARQSATNKLSAMGPAAFDALADAAQGESREVRTRAMEILGDHFRTGEETVKRAAAESLQKIAASETAAGHLAKEILAPPAKNMSLEQQRRMQAIQIAMANRAINVVPGQRIQIRRARPANPLIPPVRGVAGKRRIQVKGGGRDIKIEVENGKIKMEIEETVDGKKKSTKVEAKDAEELKKKFPNEYKIFEQYAGRGGLGAAMRMQVAPQQRILDSLKRSEERLEKEEKDVRQRLEGDALQRALRTIETRRDMYKKIRSRYEDRQKAG